MGGAWLPHALVIIRRSAAPPFGVPRAIVSVTDTLSQESVTDDDDCTHPLRRHFLAKKLVSLPAADTLLDFAGAPFFAGGGEPGGCAAGRDGSARARARESPQPAARRRRTAQGHAQARSAARAQRGHGARARTPSPRTCLSAFRGAPLADAASLGAAGTEGLGADSGTSTSTSSQKSSVIM